MNKNLFLLLFLFTISVKSKYIKEEIEEIEEIVPKILIIRNEDYNFNRIFKYNIPSNIDSNKTNIIVQSSFTTLLIWNNFYIYLYDQYSKIEKDENGKFINYISYETLSKTNFTFKDLKCDNDYYFVFDYKPSFLGTIYLEITFINEDTKTINISPLLFDYFSISPRKIDTIENFFYCFNETKYAFIQFNEGNLIIKENDNIIYENETRIFQKIFEFKKDQKYNIYYNSSSASAIHIQFYNESKFFKHDINKRPIILLGQLDFYLEIDISEYEIGEYMIFETYDSQSIFSIKYQYKQDFKHNNFIYLGDYFDFNYIIIKKIKNDSSLLLYLKNKDKFLSILNKYKVSKVKEITSDFQDIFKGPQLFILDYNK